MRACFRSKPKLPPLGKEDQKLIGTLSHYSFEALRIALSHREIGRGGGATVLVGNHELPRGVVSLYLSHLEEVTNWKRERQGCWLILFTGLTALLAAAIAVATLLPELGRFRPSSVPPLTEEDLLAQPPEYLP